MTKFGVAQSVRRVEDPRLLKGHGAYTDDIQLPGTVHGVVLRSPHAAARILSIDVAAAEATPGVLAVITAADLKADGLGGIPCAISLKNRDGSQQYSPPRPALADGAVRHVGDPVAFVVAETAQAARDGAEAILVDYDTLPAITDPGAAMEPGAPQVWEGARNNVCFDWEIGQKDKVEALFRQAAHVSRLTVVNNRIVVASMEARAACAEYDAATGRFTLRANTQGGWGIKQMLGDDIFKVGADRFRIITPDVGGGFGMKLFLYPEHVLTCYAARRLGRPVKWTSERSEAFLADTHGRDNITLGELALDAEGKFLALRTRNIANMGAYLSNYAPFIPTLAGTGVLAGVYGFQAVYANVIGVFTHTVPVDAYRGAGRPEANYLVERLIDHAARELKIDRAELRRRNMVGPEAMPHTTPVGKVYDSGDFRTVLDAALRNMDWAGFEARRAEAAARGRRRGIGLSYYLEATGGASSERAEIRFAEDGFVDVYVGTQSTGQGHETAYVQLTVDRLGVPGEKVRIRQGDTDTIPEGGGTGGARSLYSEGQAILATAATVIERGRKAASEALEASPADIVFEAGRFAIVGTDRGIDILELAQTQRARARQGQDVTTLDAAEVAQISAHTFPNGCHIAEVEIDPETGTVQVQRYSVTDDVGRAVNPLIVRGQVHGGVAQGFGQAVLERTAYDPQSGQLLSGSFMDYALPRAADLPDIEVDLIEVPCGTNPLGVKGAGEAGAVGSPPAVINAIVDALAPLGVDHIDMPATPERVWQALATARAA
ncbi:Xanthine dehydrogenase family protein molybdopterin-binding subunit [Rhodovastum atsumiense]|uniref:Xanthine dehydrogenase family protein molybdopterin-binding subunit n=1 Tax=Rhodovastum atsumiense TaxID=504468 RepID=A0A5M6IUR4_9PROT|nr:xanthine dehydrogenase family protein molybdopterin-binding subunit [Rhodovastum atsumiense]KAA5611689.1 xanthine dehydrogenase family protein molybdopterin-binding subunit [Rhodovastum atsumiense]CAH2604262.1 Xanthine dehydrogenase family protein molybdopterin-binding subunit [Rhodovastum atsumiense]